jgi:hypothetical protein
MKQMRAGAIVIGILALALLPCAVIAADNPKVSLDTQGITLDQAISDLSEQCGKQILCDTGITGTISGHFSSIDLEKLLDAITSSNGLKWQKLYMPSKADEKPTLEQVKARAEAIAAVTGDPVVVYDPATGKQKVFIVQDSASASIDPEKLGLKPVYLITKPSTETTDEKKDDKKGSLSRFTTLQNERAKLLAQMTPEERIEAFQQEMIYMLQLDPATRQQMMLAEMNAQHNMDPGMRDQYRQMMRETRRALRDQGLLPQGNWGGRDNGGGGQGGGRRNRQRDGGGDGQ